VGGAATGNVSRQPPEPPAVTAPTDAVERHIVTDMVRRALPALPVIVLVAGLIWGRDGALSAAFAIGVVILNFAAAAGILTWAARMSPVVLALGALGGFVVRLALITVAVLAVKDQSWVELVPLGLTLVATHLGLLIWESKHLSISFAFPGVRPAAPERG
jgi:hypothetical protein